MDNFNLTSVKRYRIFIIIGGILLLVTFIYLIINTISQSKRQEQTQTEYKPSIPPYTGKKLSQAPGFDEEIAKIKDILPYQGPGYVIEYLSANVVIIKISAETKEDYLKAKESAETFIRKKGITNLCTLSIFWVSESDTVRETLTAPDITTTGCPRK